MQTFTLLMVLLLVSLISCLAFFALSSCLGDEIRAAWSGRSSRRDLPRTYGGDYARMMASTQGAGWEHIEMEDMLDKANAATRRESDDFEHVR